MSAIRETIRELELEDEVRKFQDEKHFQEQARKYMEAKAKLDQMKERTEKYMSNITRGLEQLLANKHTIEKALEQGDNPIGLPIPFEQHGAVVDLFSKMTGFLNNTDALKTKSIFSPEEIGQDVVQATKDVENDLKDCSDEFIQAQTLYHQTKSFKKLITEMNDDTTLNLDNSLNQ